MALIYCVMNNMCGESVMTTSYNGNIFCVTGPLWENSPVTGEVPSQRSVTLSSDVFFHLISAWTNGQVNNRDAGDSGRHGTQYDVIVIVDSMTLRLRLFHAWRYASANQANIYDNSSYCDSSFHSPTRLLCAPIMHHIASGLDPLMVICVADDASILDFRFLYHNVIVFPMQSIKESNLRLAVSRCG